jgi:GT2 family glycosyltransferase
MVGAVTQIAIKSSLRPNESKNMYLSIVIVSWNAKDYLRKCLSSIYSQKFQKNFETIVIDNFSNDNSAEIVEKEFPQVVVIRAKENLGFAKANNIGIQISRSHYIALINSDVELLDGCLEKICNYMDENQTVGIAGPRVLNTDFSVQASCRRLPSLWRNLCGALFLNKLFKNFLFFSGEQMGYFDYDSTCRVEVLSGCFWVVRRKAIEQVGYLDERFFIYSEDIDWCKRFLASKWYVVFFSEATAVHHSSASSINEPIRFSVEQVKARFQYWHKYYKSIHVVILCLILLVHYGLRVIGEIINNKIKIKWINDNKKNNIGTNIASMKAVMNVFLKILFKY